MEGPPPLLEKLADAGAWQREDGRAALGGIAAKLARLEQEAEAAGLIMLAFLLSQARREAERERERGGKSSCRHHPTAR